MSHRTLDVILSLSIWNMSPVRDFGGLWPGYYRCNHVHIDTQSAFFLASLIQANNNNQEHLFHLPEFLVFPLSRTTVLC